MMREPDESGVVQANDTTLYYEKRGGGPPLLFISGACGDASDHAPVASLLADEFTTITYDRRGFARSPWPVDATWTWVDQHGDDAAALLGALRCTPAAVFGGSIGALTALSLLLHHPSVLTKVIIHEPPLLAGLDDPAEGMVDLRRVVAAGKAAAGLSGGREAFLRASLGDANYEAVPPDYRRRLLAGAATFLIHEFDRFEWYHPAEEQLASVQNPVAVLAGRESPAFFRPIAEWLAARLGTEVVAINGGHTPQRDHPDEVAATIRSFLSTA